MPLTPKQRQFLKGIGHGLKPIITVGKEGLSKGVIDSLSKALDDHELVKIGLLETAELERDEAAKELAEQVCAEVVQIIGFKVLLFRRNPKNPKIQVPGLKLEEKRDGE